MVAAPDPAKKLSTVIEYVFYLRAGSIGLVCMFEMVPGCVAEAFAALDEANRHARAAVVERWGVLLTARIPEFLAGSRVTVRPVVDPWVISPETPHRPSVSLRTAVEALMPHDVFPYGATPSRSCDLDHTIPYVDDGVPGCPCEAG